MSDGRPAVNVVETNRVTTVLSAVIFSIVLLIALFGSLVILLQHIFHWALEDWFTSFFAPFVKMFGYAVFGLCMLVSFAYLISTLPQRRWRSAIPLFIHLVALTLLFTVPFTNVSLKLDYHMNKSKREDVVRMVAEGTLKPDGAYRASFIELPAPYKSLSKGGGEVFVQGRGPDLLVLFYTLREGPDHYEGFVFTADAGSLESKISGNLVQVKTMSDDWHWIRVE